MTADTKTPLEHVKADRIESLMTRQSELYDVLVAGIAALEELVMELTPDEAGAGTDS